MSTEPEEGGKFWARSIFGYKTRKPLVDLRYKDWALQVDTHTAREIALHILEAAEAADQDAFIFEFGAEVAGDGDGGNNERAGSTLLHEFREWRDKKRQARSGDSHSLQAGA